MMLTRATDSSLQSTATLLTQRRVLVVDDDVDSVISLSALLREVFGAEVHVADDGVRALQMVVQLKPDIVLMDISMPGMDGLRAATILRSLMPEDHQPMLVAVTGLDLVANGESIASAGYDAALSKPLSLGALQDVFKRLLPARKDV